MPAVPGEWLSWQAWGHCSQTCAGGVRVRTRRCNMTAYGDLTIDCVGSNSESGECNAGVECIAVRSCQDLKNSGFDYDMTTTIDPDGPSGPIKPFSVFCRLSGSDAFGYSIVNTTNMSLPGIYAHGSEPGGSIHIHIDYQGGATAQQLNSLAQLSLNCSQFVRYTCHDAGIHYQNNVYLQATWWVNYRWQQMLGWAQPYSLRYQSVCACHATGSCGTLTTNVEGVDTVVQATCNCDRNERVENIFDEGTIYDKTNLPVNEVWVGDTGDATEWSHTYVGPLVCWGFDPSAGR
ncbi:hypothetical protein BOX15_Mlig018545g3 [Macrostomum lignano]|uniref:GON domain-containing protein n=2 Tax=Macrostomum lignano TaxID=282301 RepID=A0A267E1W5_9PLAT|nr:hypothetical protein BOX15_Mlig018545g1 [Macrostomum lignano]PAA94667.1 hypothetical protein BOX15_Mlig018545g3 [Macrostomum lignano]